MTDMKADTDNSDGIKSSRPPLSHDLDAVRELRMALKVAVPVEDADRVEQRRAQLLPLIEREIRQAPLSRRRADKRAHLGRLLRVGSAAAVVAMTLGVAMAIHSSQNATNLLSSAVNIKSDAHSNADAAPNTQGNTAQTSDSSSQQDTLFEGTSVHTLEDDKKSFSLPGDTTVEVGPNSQLRLLSAKIDNQVMSLSRGSIQVSVPPKTEKLKTEGANRSLKVITPHAQVKVVGTRFRVEVLPQEETIPPVRLYTRVSVDRGTVLVYHEEGVQKLQAGDSWSSAAHQRKLLQNKQTVPLGSTSASKNSTKAKGSRTSAPTHRVQSTSNAKPSTLAKQNFLLETALAAADRGDNKKAFRLTNKLLKDYPSSPLRASTYALRKRIRVDLPQRAPSD